MKTKENSDELRQLALHHEELHARYRKLRAGTSLSIKTPDLIDAARQLLLHELSDILVKGTIHGYPREMRLMGNYFDDIVQICIFDAGYEWCRSEEVRGIVEGYFVQCLVRGALSSARFLLKRFGTDFDFWSEYGEPSFDVALKKLMRSAMAKAEKENQYGTASALAKLLGEIEQANAMSEKAHELGQKVGLTTYM